MLGRDADAGGFSGWLDVLTADGTRVQVVEGFSQSPDFVALTAQPLLNWVRTIGQGDTLIAGSGYNTLMGAVLSDTFVFEAAQPGTNMVLAFEAWDKLEFLGFGYDSDAQVIANLSRSGADMVFSDQGVTVIFQGVDLALFIDEMFL